MKISLSEGVRSIVNTTAELALAQGFSIEVVNAAVVKARQRQVSDECRKRIYAVASAETQMNMASFASIISGKVHGDRSEKDNDFVAGFALALSWVQDMRDAVPKIAESILVSDLAEANWPEIPPEALAVAQRF